MLIFDIWPELLEEAYFFVNNSKQCFYSHMCESIYLLYVLEGTCEVYSLQL